MTDLVSYTPIGASLTERQVKRDIQRSKREAAAAVARHNARVEVVADVTEAALCAAAEISLLEGVLGANIPGSAGRLAHIADAGALGLAKIVTKASR